MGRKMPSLLVAVECPLPGYEGISVSYDVGKSIGTVDKYRNDLPTFMRALKIEIHGWDFEDDEGNPIPVPSAETGVDTISPVFLFWMFDDGYKEAVKQAGRPLALSNDAKPISMPSASEKGRTSRRK